MPQLLRRHQIEFGKTDAKSSFITRDQSAKKLFIDAFASPEQHEIDAIRSGDRFIFYGTKGSGKTALLRYMLEMEKNAGNVTKAIVFSEDISAQERDKIAQNLEFDNEVKPDIGDDVDTRDMWRVYLAQKIAELLSSDNRMFDACKDASRLHAVISKIFDDNKVRGLQRILSGIKAGQLTLKGKAGDFAEMEAMLNWEKPEDGSINYNRFADLVIEKICKFHYPSDIKFIVYLDELNLSMIGQKQHKRDSILIRDLIITVGQLNRRFIEAGIPVYLYTAVRVEIAKAASISRNEIDKYLVDHGFHLDWHKGADVTKYPIFDIIEKRISAIEMKHFGKCNTNNEIWTSYFSRDIFGVSPKQFISEITWCNPRDIVNLFNAATNVTPGATQYNTNVFADVLVEYSDIAWTERAEELNAAHNMSVVNVMRRILAGWERHFTVDQFTRRAESIAARDQLVMQVVKTLGAEGICRDLYHVGVLGQSVRAGKTYTNNDGRVVYPTHQTWFYRDNREFDRSETLSVHRALFSCLKLGRLKVDDFGNDPRYWQHKQ
ncbi:hypothetical protein FJ960_00555 [Mesorhizobium sp. B2-3-11]|uniref:P-loop ATPase, Sll1717 family n=1 Tax=Mesorhizobium sp. B2-3-11 TaxID=2589953 RepID=UPI001125CA6F|nr:hypothetical protein [Mesorhizobium sp. B2-3-11]TPM11283.1 hypothetical protein FJ960_00555 [Mesorhizobium sp. B2-3-11]